MPLNFNPQDIPVIGVDEHLPPVPAARLGAAALRQRFDRPPAWTPEIVGEARFTQRAASHAAVLVPLVMRDDVPYVLLTQRTDHLTDHPGQISFPGGRVDPGDTDAVATALREAAEEIGLTAPHIEVLGPMPTYTTGTGFIVTPVVALVSPDFESTADPFEVAEIFEVPLSFLMSPAHHRRHEIEVAGARRQFFSMPYQQKCDSGPPRHYFIWGATAGMLRNLYRLLSA